MKTCKNCNKEFNDDYGYCPMCGTKLEVMVPAMPSIDVSKHNSAKWEDAMHKIIAITEPHADKRGWVAVAYAFPKVAEVIFDNFEESDFNCLVQPTEIDQQADPKLLPLHFLFYKNGRPKAAIVLTTENGAYVPSVKATRAFCEGHDITYLRLYADGFWADWLTGKCKDGSDVTPEVVDMCKSRIVERVKTALKNK